MRAAALSICFMIIAGTSWPTPPALAEPGPQAQAEQASPAAPQSAEEVEMSTYIDGPWRAEILAMREVRLRLLQDIKLPPGIESDLRMQIRIAGADLTKVVSFGNLILTEVVDDTGKSLVDENTYSEQEKTTMRSMMIPPERLKETGLLLTTRNKEAARGAAKLSRVKGAVRLLLAENAESCTIVNPEQFKGQRLEHPRLQALDVEVRVAPHEDFEQAPPPQCVILQIKSKPEQIKAVQFYNGWMQRLPYRERRLVDRNGAECKAYCFQSEVINDELQLVLEVYPEIEEISVRLNETDVELP
jgi:hypothetical protein